MHDPAREPEVLRRGRDAFARGAWDTARAALLDADRASALAPEDLERLAIAARLVGRNDDMVAATERAHHASLRLGDTEGAARAAFWLGLHLQFEGEAARSSGWLARAARLLDDAGL